MKPKIYIPLIVIAMAVIIFFSRKFVKYDAKPILVDTTIAQPDKDKMEDVFLFLPSPYEIISYIEQNELVFNTKLLNPLSNKDKYLVSTDRKINIGIYSADVAYMVFFKKDQNIGEYFKIIDALCKEESFPSVLDEALKNRITQNNFNADSLSVLSTEIYQRTVDNMVESGQKSSYALLLSGSLVETLYLIIHSGHKDIAYIKKRIAEQKLMFDDLFALLEKLKKNKNINETMDELQGIKNAFSRINIKTNKLKMAQLKGNAYNLSGENVFEFTNATYDSLVLEITKLRKQWTEK